MRILKISMTGVIAKIPQDCTPLILQYSKMRIKVNKQSEGPDVLHTGTISYRWSFLMQMLTFNFNSFLNPLSYYINEYFILINCLTFTGPLVDRTCRLVCRIQPNRIHTQKIYHIYLTSFLACLYLKKMLTLYQRQNS